MYTLGELLEQRATQSAEKEALIWSTSFHTFKEYNERVNQLAHYLLSHNVKKGDRIAILCQNNHPFPTILLAALRIGAVAVPISWQLTKYEIIDILDSAQPKVIFYDQKFHEVIPFDSGLLNDVITLQVGRKNSVETTEEYNEIFSAYSILNPNIKVSQDDIAMLLFTSGTTGNAKGCMIEHGHVYSYIQPSSQRIDYEEDGRFLASHPFYHMSSINNILKSVSNGMGLFLLSDPTPEIIWETIETHEITMMLAFPSMYMQMLEIVKNAESKSSSLKVAIAGGAKVPAYLIKEYEKLGIRMIQGYGSTEAWTVSVWTPDMGNEKIESAGKPLSGVEVKIIDPESGQEVKTGEVGEIIIKSPYCFKGYWHNQEATDKVLRDGWFYMGDAGKIDQDGFLYIMGRYKDVIVYGGDNIYPDQVEEIIEQMDTVIEAAVVGVEDPVYGEKPVAYVVKDPVSPLIKEDILNYCRERLASYKVPEVYFIDQLPKNQLGKVLKRELK
ncbi:class I adenylate-forming enzyme family protein [Priestia megaterium]|uniref:class I adenylate-forming enzyme family protein n=1 Tax=Priestia megaterium TaxID=1404 RepID=UPI0004727657|nr:class I adenylate-forming enzyme family protein [Priestia megaterium]PFB00340.1 long-chain fatty acid--CoA ligase [Priestia megaterium]